MAHVGEKKNARSAADRLQSILVHFSRYGMLRKIRITQVPPGKTRSVAIITDPTNRASISPDVGRAGNWLTQYRMCCRQNQPVYCIAAEHAVSPPSSLLRKCNRWVSLLQYKKACLLGRTYDKKKYWRANILARSTSRFLLPVEYYWKNYWQYIPWPCAALSTGGL